MAQETQLRDIADHEALAVVPDDNLTPGVVPESADALDKLLGAVRDEGKPPAEGTPPVVAPEPEVQPKADAAPPGAEAKPVEGEQPKPEEAKPAAAPKDAYDAIKLPPHASPKSSEAFELVKTRARESEAKLVTQVGELTGKLSVAEKELGELKANQGKLPDEVNTELGELRKFKLSHDVESDPEFRTIDSKIKSNTESVYKKLEEAGIPADKVAKFREIGADKVDWEPWMPRLSFGIRNFVAAKLTENVTLAEQRGEALDKARSNASQFMQERSTREVRELTDTANMFLKDLPWTAERSVPANATPEQKAEVESGNAFARQSQEMLKTFLSDRSPARFAETAVGTVMAYKFKADFDATRARLDKVEGERKTEVDKLTKERDALKTELATLKRVENPKAGGIVPPRQAPKPGAADLRDGAEALDSIFTDIRKARQQ